MYKAISIIGVWIGYGICCFKDGANLTIIAPVVATFYILNLWQKELTNGR